MMAISEFKTFISDTKMNFNLIAEVTITKTVCCFFNCFYHKINYLQKNETQQFLRITKAPTRFELMISCLLDRRFNQLSHGAT